MEHLYVQNFQFPIGDLHICSDGTAVTKLGFGRCIATQSCGVIEQCAQELEEYCAGSRRSFNVPFRLSGTEFQMKIWGLLQEIPYGQTSTYGALAAKAGNPKASRAVGMACNRNPIAILVPCHRVVGSTGSLTGYAGGLEFKRNLLELEGAYHG